MSFCAECGARLPDGALLCSECGAQMKPPRKQSRRPDREPKSASDKGSLISQWKRGLRREVEEELADPSDEAARSGSRDTAEPKRALGGISAPRSFSSTPSPRPLRLESPSLSRVKGGTLFVQVGDVNEDGRFVPTGSGSGFVIDTRGWAVTNRHVVQGASVVLVVFHCGTASVGASPAQVLLSESPMDLALLRVDPLEEVPVLGLGDSARVGETDPAWAVGYPLGTDLEISLQDAGYQANRNGPEVSVREGTITAIRHDSEGRIKLLEHNCHIAPGNSGGPLVDGEGNVIGVNTLGSERAGLDFAIPSRVLGEFVRAVGGPDLDT